jgi:hypothetical protein
MNRRTVSFPNRQEVLADAAIEPRLNAGDTRKIFPSFGSKTSSP